jgi:hypothetical protein
MVDFPLYLWVQMSFPVPPHHWTSVQTRFTELDTLLTAQRCTCANKQLSAKSHTCLHHHESSNFYSKIRHYLNLQDALSKGKGRNMGPLSPGSSCTTLVHLSEASTYHVIPEVVDAWDHRVEEPHTEPAMAIPNTTRHVSEKAGSVRKIDDLNIELKARSESVMLLHTTFSWFYSYTGKVDW